VRYGAVEGAVAGADVAAGRDVRQMSGVGSSLNALLQMGILPAHAPTR